MESEWKKRTDEDFPQELLGEKFFQQYGTPVIVEKPKRVSISVKNDSKFSRLIFIPVASND